MNTIIEDHEQECTVQEQNRIISINLNYRDITQIGSISEKYRKIQELYLNHNLIQNLDGIQQFFNLQILSLKFNLVGKVEEFMKILNKKQLKSLNLIGNPAESDERCTMTVFLTCFPNLLCFNDESNPRKQQTENSAPISSKKSTTPKKQPNFTELTTYEKSTSRQQITNNSRSPVTKNTLKREPSRPKGIPNQTISLKEQDLNLNRNLLEVYPNQRTATFAEFQCQVSKKLDFVSKNLSKNSIRSDLIPKRRNQNENTAAQGNRILSGLSQKNGIYEQGSGILNKCLQSKSPARDVPKSKFENTLILDSSMALQSNVFEKHITNIERDIEDLASMFHNKRLCERSFQAFARNMLESSQKKLLANYSYKNKLQISVFYSWQSIVNQAKKRAAMLRAVTVPSQLSATYHNSRTQRDVEEEMRSSLYNFNKHATTVRRGY